MRIGIEARFVSNASGGIQQVVIGMARGLSELGDCGDEYHFILWRPGGEWLAPYLSGDCRAAWVENPPLPVAPRPHPLRKFIAPRLWEGLRALRDEVRHAKRDYAPPA